MQQKKKPAVELFEAHGGLNKRFIVNSLASLATFDQWLKCWKSHYIYEWILRSIFAITWIIDILNFGI